METIKEVLTSRPWDKNDEAYDEEWLVVMNTKGQYTLNKYQALGLKQEIANGNRGIILFQTFSIPIPYIAEFYRVKRFLKGALELPATAGEQPYEPIPADRWEEIKKNIANKLNI